MAAHGSYKRVFLVSTAAVLLGVGVYLGGAGTGPAAALENAASESAPRELPAARPPADAEVRPVPVPSAAPPVAASSGEAVEEPESPEARRAAAMSGEAAFIALEESFEAYMDQWGGYGLDDSSERSTQDQFLRDALRTKADALEELQVAYDEIATHEAPEWTARALSRQGALQEEMAVWLEALPGPTYLTEEQREMYVQAIYEKADGHRQQASALYQDALEQTAEGDRAALEEALERVATDEEEE